MLSEPCNSLKTVASVKSSSDCQIVQGTPMSVQIKMGFMDAKNTTDNNCKLSDIQIFSDEDCKILDSD